MVATNDDILKELKRQTALLSRLFSDETSIATLTKSETLDLQLEAKP